MEPTREVTATFALRLREVAPGFTQDSIQYGGPLALDPFLSITEFHMSEPTFAPHPHAGFSAVTYLFRDSAGSFVNRDSLGDHSVIGPGALHWTQAAHGMMHEEIPMVRGVDCHGMQLFVNLSPAHKTAPPRAFHVDAAEVPVVRPADGITVHVVAGAAFGAASPLTELLTEVALLDVSLDAGVAATIPVSVADRAVVLILAGEVSIGGRALAQHVVATLDGPEGSIAVTASADGATFLVLTGAPIGAPVVFGGPFCMNTNAEITDAQQRFRRGEMGHLERSF